MARAGVIVHHQVALDGNDTGRSIWPLYVWATLPEMSWMVVSREHVEHDHVVARPVSLGYWYSNTWGSMASKGTAKTLSVALGNEYCLQTPHLGLRRYGHSVQKPTNLSSYEVRKDANRTCFNFTVSRCRFDA